MKRWKQNPNINANQIARTPATNTHSHTYTYEYSVPLTTTISLHQNALDVSAAAPLRRCYCAIAANAATLLLPLGLFYLCICKHIKTHTRTHLAAPLSLHIFQANFFQKHTERQKGPLDRYFRFQFEPESTTVPLAMQKHNETGAATAETNPKCYRSIDEVLSTLYTRYQVRCVSLLSWECVLAI